MHILLLGAGALGSLFAARLQSAGCRPALYGLNTDHLQVVAENGLLVHELDGSRSCWQLRVYMASQHIDPSPDLVLVLVKSYATGEAVSSILPFCHEQTVFVTVQNGMGNWEQIAEHIPASRILAGVTAQAATMIEPGLIRHGGSGPTVLGAVHDPGPAELPELVRLLNQAGLDCEATGRVDDHIWAKLFVNIGINAVTALSAVPNGWISECGPAREVAEAAVLEAMEVAKARGSHPEADTVERVMRVAQATALNHSSMLQDVQGARRTEVEAINGIICRWGQECGVSTPVNMVLRNLVQVTEQKNQDREKRSKA